MNRRMMNLWPCQSGQGGRGAAKIAALCCISPRPDFEKLSAHARALIAAQQLVMSILKTGWWTTTLQQLLLLFCNLYDFTQKQTELLADDMWFSQAERDENNHYRLEGVAGRFFESVFINIYIFAYTPIYIYLYIIYLYIFTYIDTHMNNA